MKTGRQRKRIAARSKGGEFQARRRKRRVYFCCIGSEIDVEKLVDRYSPLLNAVTILKRKLFLPFPHPRFLGKGITCKLYDEVLHICIEKDLMNMPQVVASHKLESVTIQEVDETLPLSRTGYSEYGDPGTLFSQSYDSETNTHHHPSLPIPATTAADSVVHHQSGISNQREVFVFGFGAVVFWGFPRGEVFVPSWSHPIICSLIQCLLLRKRRCSRLLGGTLRKDCCPQKSFSMEKMTWPLLQPAFMGEMTSRPVISPQLSRLRA